MSKIISRPGPRFIYPELVSSQSLSRCGLVANTLWPRLICQADDQGRMQGDPGSVLVACFPKLLNVVTLADVVTAIDELKKARMVLVYRSSGETFLQIAGWWRWQQGMRRAYASRFSPPRGWTDITYGYEGQPSSFGNALESLGFVLSSDGKVRAVRPQSAGSVPAVRPHSARSIARAQGHDPSNPDPSSHDPSSHDPSNPDPSSTGGSVPPRTRANGAAHPDRRAVDESIAIASDPAKPDSVRRAARRAVERHAPERVSEIGATA